MIDISWKIDNICDKYKRLLDNDAIKMIDDEYDKIMDNDNIIQNLIKQREYINESISKQKSIVNKQITIYNKISKRILTDLDLNLHIGSVIYLNSNYIDPIGLVSGGIKITKINKRSVIFKYNSNIIKMSKYEFNKMYLSSLSDNEIEILIRDRTLNMILSE